jgi:4-hydroxybenzoate polyprenyltransferase
MAKKLTAYLQLIRLPNVITAAADSLAGWLLVTGSMAEPWRWASLALASMCLYASGTVLNDLFDIEVDRLERPERPLPSGRASTRVAAWLGGLGLVIGPGLALASGSAASGIVATVLAGVILSYDAGLKHTRLGPGLMGACRGLNLLLGMTHARALGGPIAWCAAAIYGLYVTGITFISRSETRTGERQGLLAGLTMQNVAIVALASLALAHRRFPNADPGLPLIPLEGLLVLAVVAMAVNLAAMGALRQPTPQTIQAAVKTGILTLIWLNVGLVAAVRGVELAAAVGGLWIPAYLLGRWLYST